MRIFVQLDRLGCLSALALVCLPMATPAAADSVVAPAVVRAAEEATLSSVIAATIDALPFDEGAAFNEGDVLARFDCALFEAEAATRRAELLAAELQAEAQERLLERGATGRADTEAARALAEASAARLAGAEVQLDGCTLTAPFDGRIVEYAVNPFEYVTPSQPMVSIMSTGLPEIEIIAPDTWLRWMGPGVTGQVRFEANAKTFDIIVTGIAPAVDPVSQTVKLTAAFRSTAERVLPGMSGRAAFDVSQSGTSLGGAGQ